MPVTLVGFAGIVGAGAAILFWVLRTSRERRLLDRLLA